MTDVTQAAPPRPSVRRPGSATAVSDVPGGSGPTIDYDEIHGSAEFQQIRRRLRAYVFPMSIGFFAWYIGYVLLADFAHGFMAQRVHGRITIGLVLGVLQFVTTVAITTAYTRFAAKNIDPLVDDLRQRVGVTDQ